MNNLSKFSGKLLNFKLAGNFYHGLVYKDGQIRARITNKRPDIKNINRDIISGNGKLSVRKPPSCVTVILTTGSETCITVGNYTSCTWQTYGYTYYTICDDGTEYGDNNPLQEPINQGGGGGGGGTQPKDIKYEKLNKDYPCAVKLIKELEEIQKFKDLISPFRGNKPDLIWDSEEMIWSNTGYRSGLTRYNSSTGGSTVLFNTKSLTQSTTLFIASTAIHESVHAYLYAIYKQNNPNDQDTKSYLYLLKNYGANNHSQAAHKFMQDNVRSIAELLSEWDNHKVKDDANFYLKLALSGLDYEDNLRTDYELLCESLDILPIDVQKTSQREAFKTLNDDGTPKYKGTELDKNCN